MGKKILFCASTQSHLLNFHLPYLKEFQEKGYEVWAAANGAREIPYTDHVVDIPFQKSMTSLKNLEAVFLLRKLFREQSFTAVSLHTMLASAVARAALLTLHRRPIVLNMVHGYLFGEQSGLGKWKYLLPEKLCAHITDLTAVMNAEDFRLAQKYHLAGKRLCKVPGLGVDLQRYHPFSEEQRQNARTAAGFSETDTIILYAAEFSHRKNQEELLRGFSLSLPECPELLLVLAGEGTLWEHCRSLAKELGISDRVRFPGHLSNMQDWYPLCDIAAASSRSEGLPFNVMEAMACGVPVVASRVKGHEDLVSPGDTGLLYESGDPAGLAQTLKQLYASSKLRNKMGTEGMRQVSSYGISAVFPQVLHDFYGALL